MREIEVLTRRWVAGWARSRDLAVGDVAGWPLVHVGSASRTTEIVCAEPSPAQWPGLLAEAAGDPSAMVTVVAAGPVPYAVTPDLGDRVRLDRDDEILMLLVAPVIGAEAGVDVSAYDLQREAVDGRLTIRLSAGDRVAAEGTVAVVDGDAVYDRIETTPAYRRAGLGTWVMGELGRWSREQDATSGLLVATPDGAALYRRIGWRRIAGVRSFTGA